MKKFLAGLGVLIIIVTTLFTFIYLNKIACIYIDFCKEPFQGERLFVFMLMVCFVIPLSIWITFKFCYSIGEFILEPIKTETESKEERFIRLEEENLIRLEEERLEKIRRRDPLYGDPEYLEFCKEILKN